MQSECPEPETFKDCAACGETWQTRGDFLEAPNIILIGYQAHFKELSAGLFLFNHSCGNTLALLAGELTDLYSGPIFTERKNETDECPGYCMNEKDLQPCPVRCECAFVRETMQIITHWPKGGTQEE